MSLNSPVWPSPLPLAAWRPLGHLAALGEGVARVLREPALREMNGGLVLGVPA